ncbi:VOC family protein [Paenibacillus mesophilus]|uniref:VOC family protein n=1 Tax=Paenibacillus mesophilus TaxID=2582849 RepID=UPI00110D8A13|nr:VOC family protein [Paenibacillus mesophilus]TMV50327.1 VOC family protein [Paenibacillus mesophilus]
MGTEPKLTSVDSIYIPVHNREQSMKWYIEQFDLEVEGDHLKIGNTELFFLETLEQQRLLFTTKDWKTGEDYYKMPVFCFRTTDIHSLYNQLKEKGIIVEDIVEHGWFEEFDLYDLDQNKLKVWKSK